MFRNLQCAAMIVATTALVAACSNNSSDSKGNGTQNCVPQNQGNNAVSQPSVPTQPPGQPGQQPPGGLPGIPGMGFVAADYQIPGIPGNQPTQPTQPPAQQQPCANKPGNGAATALEGTWMGDDEMSQEAGTSVKMRLVFQGSNMTVSAICFNNTTAAEASITVPVQTNGDQLVVQRGDQASTRFGNGQCSVQLKAQSVVFSLAEPKLTIRTQDGTMNFTRVGQPPAPPQQGGPISQPTPGNPGQQPAPGNPGQGVLGQWATDEISNDPRVSLHLIFRIDANQMMAMLACIDTQTKQQAQATVFVPVTIDSHTINVNQGAQNSQRLGELGDCKIDFPAGPIDYQVNGNTMNLTKDGQTYSVRRF